MRPLRTKAGPAVTASRVHCRLRCGVHWSLARAASGAGEGVGAVGGLGQVQQVGAFGVVELEGAGDGFEDGRGDAGEVAAFEFGVVLDADVGQRGDLAACAGRARGAGIRRAAPPARG